MWKEYGIRHLYTISHDTFVRDMTHRNMGYGIYIRYLSTRDIILNTLDSPYKCVMSLTNVSCLLHLYTRDIINYLHTLDIRYRAFIYCIQYLNLILQTDSTDRYIFITNRIWYCRQYSSAFILHLTYSICLTYYIYIYISYFVSKV